MNQFKTFFKELFTEAETFQARSKESGKLVNFKSKAAADAAVKAGSHEDPKAPKSGKAGGKDSKKTTPAPNIFDKPKADTSKAPAMKHTKVGEDSIEVNTISNFTNLRGKFVADFINKHKLDANGIANFVKNGSLRDRMDIGTAMAGNPGNKYEKKVIKQFAAKEEQPKADPTSQSKSSKEEPKASTSKADTTDDRWGDRFELGTPAVYNDNGKEYSGEVVMNKSNQQVQINGQWRMIGKGTHKGIQVYGSDTFIIPDNWNDVKSFDDSMETPKSEPSQPKQQRKGNPQVNIAAKKAAEEAGITPQKLGGEYPDTMLKAAVEALTDSNYHDEARELIAKLEGKPEWAKKPEYPSMDDPKYNEKMRALKATGVDSSEYWDYDDNTGRFARKVSSESSWDGGAAADGIAFTLRMNGFHKEADIIQSVLKESVTRLTTILKETTYSKKKSKFKSLINEASEPEIISQLKDIVKKKQYQDVKDPKTGKKMKVDMQTANAVLQIYDGLSNVNKDTMVKMGLPKMIDVSNKIISKYK